VSALNLNIVKKFYRTAINPFSVLHALKNSNYGSYWFSTGAPTYLVELLKEQNGSKSVIRI
jgi:hypothetical protein